MDGTRRRPRRALKFLPGVYVLEHTATMAFLGLRKWPTPVAKPMAPFIAATALTYYLIGSLQDMGVRSETYANDPKNPYAAQIAKEKAAAHH